VNTFKNQNFTASIEVDKSPKEVSKAAAQTSMMNLILARDMVIKDWLFNYITNDKVI
jgi:hypothetical protein